MSSHISQVSSYRGRFAPTPTGPLHMGSLIAALASYLDAKANNGKWLLRIDDIDPPREVKGATVSILKCLEAFGLFWDEEVVYQSKQYAKYESFLSQISSKTYSCICSRKQIGPNVYQSTCFGKSVDLNLPHCVRFHIDYPNVEFEDRIQLAQTLFQNEDFVIKRKGNLWSYHLAVVVDDYLSGITDVVRGVDLLDSTFRHIQLQKTLGFTVPRYAHIPVLVESNGQKLSKQNLAKPVGVSSQNIEQELKFALVKLGIDVKDNQNVQEMLKFAVQCWDINSLKGKKTMQNQ
ncbi:MAG: tRNA glutamyl-Q(34) synthetase GluQRS [Saccharospirillaceae bacterium]|nr:tRNA glutamyl-Q(34) synthetase GluQRS [Pseudomonadales bacterium]NRB78232.1 tRNA glutamyl-Q(34) synthetase GluQRS [Saccharospirillaceae bacterium]